MCNDAIVMDTNSLSFAEDVLQSLNVDLIYLNQFDWKKYFETYPDIQGEHNELNAYKHWIELGQQENRCAGKKFSQEPFERFEYESYAKLNPDLEDFNENSGLENNNSITTDPASKNSLEFPKFGNDISIASKDGRRSTEVLSRNKGLENVDKKRRNSISQLLGFSPRTRKEILEKEKTLG